MVRTYVRKTTRGNWSPATMKKAIQAVSTRGVRKAAKEFGIPKSTLERHAKGKVTSPGDLRLGSLQPVLLGFEDELKDYIFKMQAMFFGLTLQDLRELAFNLADRNKIQHPFNTEKRMAGQTWVQGFLRRHPDVSVRMPEATSLSRAAGFNRVQVGRFFDKLKGIFTENQMTPDRIFNVDETGITSVQKPCKVLSKKGLKQVGKVTSAERGKTVTAVCAISATGVYIPPVLIFPRKRMVDTLMNGAPTGAKGFVTDSGWIDKNVFLKWLQHFSEHVRPSKENKVCLVLDNHCSHTSLEAIDFCRENGIILMSIPPHTSHRTQPLDRTVYGPLKTFYNQEIDKWMVSHPGQRVTDYDLCTLFGAAYTRTASVEKAVKGFESCGIWPFNPDVFSENDFAPAEVTDNTGLQEAGASHPSSEQASTASPAPGESEVANTRNTSTLSAEHDCQEANASAPLLVPGTSTGPAEESHVSPFDIAPLPKSPQVAQRKRKAKQAEELTSSPYKKALLEAGTLRKGKGKGKGKKLRAQSGQSKKKETPQASQSTDACFYCSEAYAEGGWIQCTECKRWAHDACAGVDDATTDFVCEFC